MTEDLVILAIVALVGLVLTPLAWWWETKHPTTLDRLSEFLEQ